MTFQRTMSAYAGAEWQHRDDWKPIGDVKLSNVSSKEKISITICGSQAIVERGIYDD